LRPLYQCVKGRTQLCHVNYCFLPPTHVHHQRGGYVPHMTAHANVGVLLVVNEDGPSPCAHPVFERPQAPIGSSIIGGAAVRVWSSLPYSLTGQQQQYDIVDMMLVVISINYEGGTQETIPNPLQPLPHQSSPPTSSPSSTMMIVNGKHLHNYSSSAIAVLNHWSLGSEEWIAGVVRPFPRRLLSPFLPWHTVFPTTLVLLARYATSATTY